MISNVLGTVLAVANAAGAIGNALNSFADNDTHKSTPIEVVDTNSVQTPIRVNPTQENYRQSPVTVNLTVNIFKDGEKIGILTSGDSSIPQLQDQTLCIDLKQPK